MSNVGFEGPAGKADKPSKSLHRRLCANGNPSMDNLAAIFAAIRAAPGIHIVVHNAPAA
ncbi:hypothetical protein HX776_20505 [Pseudomonas agarici]|nr:hypothetical protein [Pseudomonas agarici]NWC11180.1 hypothetical protein [Pseudomonas agarici]SEL00248.1 hypothetical protein SAMN05216604_109124 [Pseudomonas agarici]